MDEHLSAMCDEPGWASVADVIVCRRGCGHRALPGALACHPGALVIARSAPDGVRLVRTRWGDEVCLTGLDTWMAGSLAHAWLVGGGVLRDLGTLAVMVRVARPSPGRPGDHGPIPLVVRPAV
ncbi:hypothetical protein [Sphaerisporangium aureirubrum]|uniref:Uncharacterized protein n=1 Tax=Sphaerisporangium aureirubrum TaxID=1544736 RepID=A0ABW1NTJ8_9ACTN